MSYAGRRARNNVAMALATGAAIVGLFFLFLAVVNEIVWRNFSEATWVAFKVWGIMPITVAPM